MTADWYYSSNGQRTGPVSEAEIRNLATTGKLSASDLVWHTGQPNWIPASSVPDLFSRRPPPPATSLMKFRKPDGVFDVDRFLWFQPTGNKKWIFCGITGALLMYVVLQSTINSERQKELEYYRNALRALEEKHERLTTKNTRLVQFEKLKSAREDKVAALIHLAETLAAARAWESDSKAYEAHCEANKTRHQLIARQMQSPDKARIVGPTEGHEPYLGSFEKAYASFLPSTKAEIFRLLDNGGEYNDLRNIYNNKCAEIRRRAEAARRTLQGTGYPFSIESQDYSTVFTPLEEYHGDNDSFRAIWNAPTSDDLRAFDASITAE